MSLKEKADRLEERVCKFFSITPDDYMELWHELGCQFAEESLKKKGLRGEALMKTRLTYQSSLMFWHYWANEWMQTCEWFFHWNYSKKSLEDFKQMQLQAMRPRPKDHEIIIQYGDSSKRQAVFAQATKQSGRAN